MGRGVVLAGMLCASVAGAAEPCPHPYFPMEEGLELTYRAGKAEVVISFSDVQQKDGERRALLHMKHKGKDGQTQAVCTKDGIATTGGLEGAALSMSGMDVEILSTEGMAMPPAKAMVEGATWSNTMKIELKAPSNMKIPLGAVRSTFTKDSVIEGRETVEVAGQKWDALRVRNKVTAMAGTTGERSMESILWLAPDVGILKIQTGESVDLELLGVKRPPEAKRTKK